MTTPPVANPKTVAKGALSLGTALRRTAHPKIDPSPKSELPSKL